MDKLDDQNTKPRPLPGKLHGRVELENSKQIFSTSHSCFVFFVCLVIWMDKMKDHSIKTFLDYFYNQSDSQVQLKLFLFCLKTFSMND